MGPKMQDVCPRINTLKENCFKTILRWIMVRQKVPNCSFSQFSAKKKKKNSIKNINLGEHFSKKLFLYDINFWTTLFSKIMPNFWRTGTPRILKIQWFPWKILIFGQKSCFLWPTISKIPSTTYTNISQDLTSEFEN